MLINLNEKLRRFPHDERGAFAAMFGLMAIAIVALSGAIVDFVKVEQARNQAQVALDAAALALQPSIYSLDEATLRQQAEDLLIERINDANIGVSVELAVANTTDGSLGLQARLTVDTIFVSLVGVRNINARLVSEATRKKLALEIAMVLDNSLSMASYSRMSNLKIAATSATNILFTGKTNPTASDVDSPNVSIAIVPFAYWVNVGASNSAELWLDQDGISPISNDNFDDDDDDSTAFDDPVDRLALYDSMVDEPWTGCVEARPYPYSVDDTPPDPTNPATLFVPTFAPDEKDSGYFNSYIGDDPLNCQSSRDCTYVRQYGGCKNNGNNCSWGPVNTYTATYPDGSTETSGSACSCNGETILSDTGYILTGPNNNKLKTRTRTCVDWYSNIGGLSDRERQERLCKYNGANPSYSGIGAGPNGGCVSTEVLPLNGARSTVIARINAMSAEGLTNIHQGAIWGFHVLSPGAPFTEGDDYDTATAKVMILMTDGENTYFSANNMNGTRYYSPYGYLWNGRLGTIGVDDAGDMQDLVDGLTVEACESAKDEDIEIYTIALNPPNQDTIDMMTACASTPAKAYFPTAASELDTVFQSIAQQLADLRLAR